MKSGERGEGEIEEGRRVKYTALNAKKHMRKKVYKKKKVPQLWFILNRKFAIKKLGK